MRAFTAFRFFASSALVLVAVAPAGAQTTNLKESIRTFENEQTPMADRIRAIEECRLFALQKANEGKSEPFRSALAPFLKDVAAKKKEATHGKLIELAFSALEIYKPFPDVGSIVKPFLTADTTVDARVAALKAIRDNGARGCGKEVAAIFEGETSDRKDKSRDTIEDAVIGACFGLPTPDAVKVLEAAIKYTKRKGVRVVAIHELGTMATLRPPGEVASSNAPQVLIEALNSKNPSMDVVCEIAIALAHLNSYEGLAALVKKTDAKSGAMGIVYRTFCDVAHNTQGWASVTRDAYESAPNSQKIAATKEMLEWFEANKNNKPEQNIYKVLQDAGIKFPKDIANSKETVSALIDALELEKRELRYAALDLLVKKTGNTELAKDFKVYTQKHGNATISFHEPDDGFPPSDPRAQQLYDLQKERAKAWRSWWAKVQSRAALDKNGVWQVP